jgi:hypothetical protein
LNRFTNTYQIERNDKVLTVSPAELKGFSEFFIRDENIRERCSERFILDLYVYANTAGLNPAMIFEELEILESPDRQSRTKPETKFSRAPLKGLWHKHFFSSHFIAKNMQIANGRGNINSVIKQALKKFEGMDRTVENCKAIAKEISSGNLELFDKRSESNQLTGEWIVFAKVDSANYYMCIDFHETDDQVVYDKVINACKDNFESLVPIIESYA